MRELSLDTLVQAIQDYLKENPDQSVRDLAKKCDVSHSVIYDLIRGKAHNTRLDIAVIIFRETGHLPLVFKDWK